MLRFTILLVGVLAPLVISNPIIRIICGPVCDIYCEYGHVIDKNGCPTCACNPSPCKDKQTPLEGYFCGRGPNRTHCPLTYECVIGSDDTYALCCPRRQQNVTTVTKPGSCPKPSGGIGSCIARCTHDSDCEGDLKCCGNCPRLCVKPVF